MSKPDDTQELDEILCQAFYIEDGEYIGSYKEGSPIGFDIKQSLLDWHNKQIKNAVATAEDNLDQYWNKELDKQIEAVLDRLASLTHEGRGTIAWEMDNMASAIEAERKKKAGV